MNFLKNIYAQFLYKTKALKKQNCCETYSINMADLPVEVIRKSIKNMHLRIYPLYGQVRVSAPKYIPDAVVRQFVHSKLSWIKLHRKKFKQQLGIAPRTYCSREEHFMRGKE